MYYIKVEDYFSSAHNLRGYQGRCEELHGHNWKVQVEVAKGSLNKAGMVEDFSFLKQELRRALDRLDHRHLNRIAYFKKVNPTSENIAQYLFSRLQKRIKRLYAVTVWESENSSATYSTRTAVRVE